MVAEHDLMSIGRRIRSLCKNDGCLPVDAQIRALDEFKVPEEDRNAVMVAILKMEEEYQSGHRPVPTKSHVTHGRGWHRVQSEPEGLPSSHKVEIVDVRKLAANDKD